MPSEVMPTKAFVFIDGNNFYHNVKLMKIKPSYIDFYKLSELVCSHFNCVHKKSIYYNSVPSIEDGKGMYYAHMKLRNCQNLRLRQENYKEVLLMRFCRKRKKYYLL